MDNNSRYDGHGYNSNGYGYRAEPENNGKPSPEQVIRELQGLKQKFNATAQDYQRMAETVGKALSLLEEVESKKTVEAQEKIKQTLEQRGALLGGMLLGAKNKDDFVVLIDGSGSMNGFPLNAALDTATVVQLGAAQAKAAPASVGLFGNSTPYWVKDSLAKGAERGKLEKGLNCGTDLEPAVTEAAKIGAVNLLDKKKTHVVVISDGDIFDREKSKEVVETLLRKNRLATIDVVIAARPGTQMEALATEVAAAFPGRIKQHRIDFVQNSQGAALSSAMQDIMMTVVADRLRPVERKKKAAPQP